MDPGGVVMLDSTKVYVKTKEQFGWPEDNEDFPEASVTAAKQSQTTSTGVNGTSSNDTDSSVSVALPLTAMDR